MNTKEFTILNKKLNHEKPCHEHDCMILNPQTM